MSAPDFHAVAMSECRKWAADLLRVAELAEQAEQITEAEADALNERAQRGGLRS